MVLALVSIPLTSSAQTNSTKTVEGSLGAISKALSANMVGKIEILRMPFNIETRSAVTPEGLERMFYSKIVIRDIALMPYHGKFAQALDSTTVLPASYSGDLRIGVIFYSQTGDRIGSLYFDRWGRHGAVNDSPVEFRGDLFRWLDNTFSRCLP
jgi:hypothetical protein